MSLSEHLPILVILLPLLSAPLCILLASPKLAWLVTQAACLLSFILSIILLQNILAHGPISYALGGWQPPWGIEYRFDLLSSSLLLLICGMATLVVCFARHSVPAEIKQQHIVPFYAALLLAIAGLGGITASGDVFNLFVFLEVSSIASYTLISMGRDRRALNAAFKYLVMGTIGATFILIGIGFLYMQTGTLNMQDLAVLLPELYDNRTIRAGFAFLTVGISLKLALFPLHLWLPNAYAFAPSAVSVFLAGTATKVAVYMLLRFLLSVFGIEFSLQDMPLNLILIALGSVAVLSCSLVAIYQNNCKRLFAYSSVAQIGYIALAIGLASHAGISAAVLHIFNHALMKGALFMALGAVLFRLGSVQIDSLQGLIKQMPLTALALIIGGLSLVGVPGTAGFISKWFLINAIIEQGLWPLTGVVLIGSVLALIYVWKMVEKVLSRKQTDTEIEAKEQVITEAPLSMLLPLWVLVGANLYFGLNTELTVDLAQQASLFLIGGER